MAFHKKQPLIQDSGLVVEWRPDHSVDPAAYDRKFAPPAADPHDAFDAANYNAIDPDKVEDLLPDVPYHFYDPLADDVPQGAHYGGEFGDNEDGEDDEEDYGQDGGDNKANGNECDEDAPNVDDNNDDGAHKANNDEAHFEDKGAHNANDADAHFEDQGAPPAAVIKRAPTAKMHAHNLRQRTTASCGFKRVMDSPHGSKADFPPRQFTQYAKKLVQFAEHHEHPGRLRIMNQMLANAGIKKHGKAAEAALMAEFSQLVELEVHEVVHPHKFTKQQQKEAFRAINLSKEKETECRGGRAKADGRPQRFMYNKSHTALPTVANDSLMSMINTHENRDVDNAEVAGA